ncbi:MAG: leucine-rich repeat protein [Clostridia bacterium]|nr:leucine-rich repeat protein [Clostridia bacterium]
MKKVISLILAAIMLLSVMGVGSFASVKSGKCGDNITWSVSGDTMTLTGSGKMYDYSGYEDIPWYDIKFGIRNLVIANGITYIGDYAFSAMGILDLVIPDSVTEIGDYSFDNSCHGTVTLGKNLKKIGHHAFAMGYYSDIKFGDKLEEIGDFAFKDSHDLKNPVVIPNGVKVISNGAFAYSAMTSVVIPDSVESIGDFAFFCANITKAEIGKNVKHIGKSAFSGCHELKQIVLPATVESFGDEAFYGCTTMKSITVFPSVKTIGESVFDNCNELVITCIKDSAIDLYAKEMGYKTDSRIFFDVSNTAWYYEGIEFCYNNGIVKGMTETTFEPNGTLTRAQFVQILAMYDLADLSEYEGVDCGFDDVKPSHWYSKAVCWAYSNGYVSGMSDTRFAPNEPITREQFARILYVYAESWGFNVDKRADLSVYDDCSKVSSWAYDQVGWAVAEGIISGVDENTLAPKNNATRAQACRMIMVFDSYLLTGSKDELFLKLVDYITTNGAVSEFDPTVTEIVEEAWDAKFVLKYDNELSCISFAYQSGELDSGYADGKYYEEYMINGMVDIYDISEFYYFDIEITDSDYENYYYRTELIYPNGTIPSYEYRSGFSDDYISSNCDTIRAMLNEFIMKHLTAAGISYDMMFLDVEYIRDGSYQILADYIMSNGSYQTSNGDYTFITDANGISFFADYNPISGTIVFRFYDGQGNEAMAADMTMYGLSDVYYFYYMYQNTQTGEYTSTERSIYADDYSISFYDIEGMDKDTVYAMEESAYAIFCEGINQILSDCGLTMADLFLTI